MRNIVALGIAFAIALACPVAAQDPAPLPKALSGRWTAVVPGVATFTDTMSMVFDGPAQAGKVAGHMTSRGVTCGAQDEPFTGTWDGAVLRVESKLHANVNVQRMNGQCASGRVVYTLTRKPGQLSFEGEGARDGMASPAQVTLSP